MVDLVEIIEEEEGWGSANLGKIADTAASTTLVHVGMEKSGYLISLLACNDTRIAELNQQFRGKNAATNVLSWPSEERRPDALPQPGSKEDPTELGDIAIALETCQREAGEQGKPIKDHVTHLIVHAVLHLLGYDHEEDSDAALMESAEIAILLQLGISDPYDLGPIDGL